MKPRLAEPSRPVRSNTSPRSAGAKREQLAARLLMFLFHTDLARLAHEFLPDVVDTGNFQARALENPCGQFQPGVNLVRIGAAAGIVVGVVVPEIQAGGHVRVGGQVVTAVERKPAGVVFVVPQAALQKLQRR